MKLCSLEPRHCREANGWELMERREGRDATLAALTYGRSFSKQHAERNAGGVAKKKESRQQYAWENLKLH